MATSTGRFDQDGWDTPNGDGRTFDMLAQYEAKAGNRQRGRSRRRANRASDTERAAQTHRAHTRPERDDTDRNPGRDDQHQLRQALEDDAPQAAFAARRSQKSSKRPLSRQQRRAMMALAPATVQRMPARLSRAPDLLASGLGRRPKRCTGPWPGTADSACGVGSRTHSECTFAPRAWSRHGCVAPRRRRGAGRRPTRHAGPWPTGRPSPFRGRRGSWPRRTDAAWRGRCRRFRWRRETARRPTARSRGRRRR